MSEEQTPFQRPEGVVHVVDDGGSAFPLNTSNVSNPGAFDAEPGMSLRDYFAGQVLGEVFRMVMALPSSEDGPSPSKWAALVAYEMADAMIAARTQSRGGAA